MLFTMNKSKMLKYVRVYFYYSVGRIPQINNEAQLKQDIKNVIRDFIEQEANVILLDVKRLPFYEDVRLVIESSGNEKAAFNIAKNIKEIISTDQASTEEYRISVRFEDEFDMRPSFNKFLGLRKKESVVIDNVFIRNFFQKKTNKVCVFSSQYFRSNLSPSLRALPDDIDNYAYVICEEDESGDIVKLEFSNMLSEQVMADIEKGKGAVVYDYE